MVRKTIEIRKEGKEKRKMSEKEMKRGKYYKLKIYYLLLHHVLSFMQSAF